MTREEFIEYLENLGFVYARTVKGDCGDFISYHWGDASDDKIVTDMPDGICVTIDTFDDTACLTGYLYDTWFKSFETTKAHIERGGVPE